MLVTLHEAGSEICRQISC